MPKRDSGNHEPQTPPDGYLTKIIWMACIFPKSCCENGSFFRFVFDEFVSTKAVSDETMFVILFYLILKRAATGRFCHELLNISIRFALILLSTLDPSPLAFGIAALFNSRRRFSKRKAAPCIYLTQKSQGDFAPGRLQSSECKEMCLNWLASARMCI